MHTLATLIEPGVVAGGRSEDGILVGRRVANEAFLQALVRHADVARFLWFVGEQAQRADVEAFVQTLAHFDPQRIEVAHRLELPDRLARGEISVVHHESHWGWFFDLVALRDHFATQHVPVTGQIHSLSYPRMLESYIRGALSPPGQGDAVFCSSSAGEAALNESLKLVTEAAAVRGIVLPDMTFERAQVPLGVDFEALDLSAAQHPREALRARLQIPNDAIVLIAMGRFSEYDKMDLFPLVRVFSWLLQECPEQNLQLVLAGARQGTGTADMVKVWAAALNVQDRVHIVLDFPASEKGGWLAAADVFVSPSDNVQETFGLSVVEAMGMGLAVVVSDFDGYKDTVPAHVGWRVNTQQESASSMLRLYGLSLFERPLHLLLGQGVSVSPRALLSALVQATQNADERNQRGHAARSWARSRFAWDVVIPQYEAVWKRLRLQAKSKPQPEPLGMDFGRVFRAHFTPCDLEQMQQNLVLVSDVDTSHMYLHPELKSLFQLTDVGAALAVLRRAPMPAPQLVNHIRALWPGGLLGDIAAYALVAWLLKHGLVERQGA